MKSYVNGSRDQSLLHQVNNLLYLKTSHLYVSKTTVNLLLLYNDIAIKSSKQREMHSNT